MYKAGKFFRLALENLFLYKNVNIQWHWCKFKLLSAELLQPYLQTKTVNKNALDLIQKQDTVICDQSSVTALEYFPSPLLSANIK